MIFGVAWLERKGNMGKRRELEYERSKGSSIWRSGSEGMEAIDRDIDDYEQVRAREGGLGCPARFGGNNLQ
jgi:hypothetical protein